MSKLQEKPAPLSHPSYFLPPSTCPPHFPFRLATPEESAALLESRVSFLSSPLSATQGSVNRYLLPPILRRRSFECPPLLHSHAIVLGSYLSVFTGNYRFDLNINLFHLSFQFLEFEMGESSFLTRILSNIQEFSRYYTGHPKEFGPSRIIHFTSERQFIQLLHEGQPVAVAFTIKCPYTKHFDSILEEAAAEFYPNIRFVRVECPKYPGFCMARQKKDYPFIEIFHNPEEAANQAKVVDPNITKYSVKVLPFNYDVSAYGFREFFKKHGFYSSNTK